MQAALHPAASMALSMRPCCQARAATLLKGKDAELRGAWEEATAEAAEQLNGIDNALKDTHKQLDQVGRALLGQPESAAIAVLVNSKHSPADGARSVVFDSYCQECTASASAAFHSLRLNTTHTVPLATQVLACLHGCAACV